jgi:hypothetical protein
MPPVEFEPTISADERPQNYALDYADTGTGNSTKLQNNFIKSTNILYKKFEWIQQAIYISK